MYIYKLIKNECPGQNATRIFMWNKLTWIFKSLHVGMVSFRNEARNVLYTQPVCSLQIVVFIPKRGISLGVFWQVTGRAYRSFEDIIFTNTIDILNNIYSDKTIRKHSNCVLTVGCRKQYYWTQLNQHYMCHLVYLILLIFIGSQII